MAVTITVDNDITIITIDRPEVRNAVDRPTAEALEAAVRAFEADPSQSVGILTGSNGQFCAGADLKAIASGRGNKVLPVGSAPGPMGPTRMEPTKPMIAAVEGHAVAGGLELAVWCDLRVAARDATFGVYCRRFGVPLVDGGTIRLSRLIGESRAMDLILTGRGVDAEEAHAMGLVNRLCDPGAALATARELAAQIAAHPQRCLRSDRLSARQGWSLDFQAALALEYELGIATITSGETLDGASAFVAGAGRHGAARSST
jgi:enoyl-CoA hydratase